MGTAKPLGNLLHCLTSHGEKVFWIFHVSLSCFNLCPLSLFLQPCTTVKSPSLSSWYPPRGCQQAAGGTPPLQLLMGGQGQPQLPLGWDIFYNRISKRVLENTAVDDFQSHRTLEIIPLLLKSCENVRSGAQKATITFDTLCLREQSCPRFELSPMKWFRGKSPGLILLISGLLACRGLVHSSFTECN